jgi:hypothetical protein
MARILLLTTLFAALTVPLALAADTPGDGSLAVKRARGAVTLKLKGTVIGRIKSGRLQIRDFRPFDPNDPQITCKSRFRHNITTGVYTCKGRNIGFRVEDGRFNVNVRGSGIWISAVGRGPVALDGSGDLGVPDGQFSIDSAPYQSLPDFLTTFFLGTPPPTRP